MATEEVTGGTERDIRELRRAYEGTPLQEKHGIPFEVAYCLHQIPFQPRDYDGPTRYCQRRVGKLKPDVFEPEAYKDFCRYHGGERNPTPENLELNGQHLIETGLWAQDENLRMNFTEEEQVLYDGIVNDWPDIYDWPSEEEDPARYEILRKVATNFVRTNRAEDYLDDEGEVRISDKYNDEGHVVEPDGVHEENPIASEYRLLMSQIMDMMAELGLTPKARQRMDSMESEESKNNAIADVASDALDGDRDYDPEEFVDD
jgi:hypothetical protein